MRKTNFRNRELQMDVEKGFSRWVKWVDRKIELESELAHPGVYALRLSKKKLANKKYTLRKEIAYFGMTTVSLKSRLQKFDNAILRKGGHSGGNRMHAWYEDPNKLIEDLFVAVKPYKLPKIEDGDQRKSPEGLRKLGKVVRFEYECFAAYSSKWGSLPKGNNPKCIDIED